VSVIELKLNSLFPQAAQSAFRERSFIERKGGEPNAEKRSMDGFLSVTWLSNKQQVDRLAAHHADLL
jgi:hypothetical protein